MNHLHQYIRISLMDDFAHARGPERHPLIAVRSLYRGTRQRPIFAHGDRDWDASASDWSVGEITRYRPGSTGDPLIIRG